MTNPHSKQAGQLGDPSNTTTSQQPYTSPPSQSSEREKGEQAARTVENIRYGQTLSENQPGTAEGHSNTGTGYGSAQVLKGEAEGAEASRQKAGYGGEQDMDRGIGG